MMLLVPAAVFSGYVVDFQLPTTDTVVTVCIGTNGTAFKDFDNYVETVNKAKRGVGFRISISNFMVRADGITLTFKAEHAVLTGWQSIDAGSRTIKTPIIKTSSVGATLQDIITNTWVHVGVSPNPATGDKPAMIRVRRVDTAQERGAAQRVGAATPCGDGICPAEAWLNEHRRTWFGSYNSCTDSLTWFAA